MKKILGLLLSFILLMNFIGLFCVSEKSTVYAEPVSYNTTANATSTSKTADTEINYVKNGSFTEDLSSWSTYKLKIEEKDGNKYVTPKEKETKVAAYLSQKLDLLPGKIYEIQVSYKGAGTLRVKVGEEENQKIPAFLDSGSGVLGKNETERQTYKNSFTYVGDTDVWLTIVMLGEIYVDDISIQINYVKNGSFTEGMSDWETVKVNKAKIVEEGSNKYAAAEDNIAYIYQTLALSSGETYEIRVSYKASGTLRVKVGEDIISKDEALISDSGRGGLGNTGDEWKIYENSFTYVGNTVEKLIIVMNGKVYVDDIAIKTKEKAGNIPTPKPTATPMPKPTATPKPAVTEKNYVENGSFTKALSSWNIDKKNEAKFDEKGKCAYVEKEKTAYLTQKLNLTPGKAYELQVSYKGTGTMRVMVRKTLNNASTFLDSGGGRLVGNATEWKTYEEKFTYDGNDDVELFIAMTGEMYVNDISVKEKAGNTSTPKPVAIPTPTPLVKNGYFDNGLDGWEIEGNVTWMEENQNAYMKKFGEKAPSTGSLTQKITLESGKYCFAMTYSGTGSTRTTITVEGKNKEKDSFLDTGYQELWAKEGEETEFKGYFFIQNEVKVKLTVIITEGCFVDNIQIWREEPFKEWIFEEKDTNGKPLFYNVQENGQYSRVRPEIGGMDDLKYTVKLYRDDEIVNAYKIGDPIYITGNYRLVVEDENGTTSKVSFSIKNIQNITSEDIVAAMGAGWNLADSLDIKNIGEEYEEKMNVRTTKEIIDTVRKQGFSSVRIPVSPDFHLAFKEKDDYKNAVKDLDCDGKAKEYLSRFTGNYEIDKNYLARIKEVVDWAIKDNLYVVLDVHNAISRNPKDIYEDSTNWKDPIDSNQEEGKKRLHSYWEQLSNMFKNYDEHLVFEIINEPYVHVPGEVGKAISTMTKENQSVLGEYYKEAIKTIRKSGGNNEYRLIIEPIYGHCFDQRNLDNTKIIKGKIAESDGTVVDAGNIATAVHVYYPTSFAYEQGGTTKFDYNERASVERVFQKLKSCLSDKGIPVIITEFGCLDKGNEQDRLKFAVCYAENSRKYGIPCFWWDTGQFKEKKPTDAFGLLDRANLIWRNQRLVNYLTK